MNRSFANETQIDNLDWIANNVIVRNLLINYLNIKADSKVWDNFW